MELLNSKTETFEHLKRNTWTINAL